MLLLRLAVLCVSRAWGAYTVQMTISPAGAEAGLAFSTQPVAKLYDDNGLIAVDFDGYMRCEMDTTPTGTEELFFNGSESLLCCASYM